MKWELQSHNISSIALDRGISVLNLMINHGDFVILVFWCICSLSYMLFYFSIVCGFIVYQLLIKQLQTSFESKWHVSQFFHIEYE